MITRRAALACLALAVSGAAGSGLALRREASARRIVVATGGRGGVYQVLGDTFVHRLRKDMDIDARAMATAAAVENLSLVGGRTADVGFATIDAAALAVAGHEPFGVPEPVLALARLHDDYVHVVVRADSPVRHLADLRGRRVSTGPRSSGSELVAERLLGLVGIAPGRNVEQSSLNATDAARALDTGRIDAFFFSGGVPTPAVLDLSIHRSIRLLALDAFAERLRAAYGGYYLARKIPASTYGTGRSTGTIAIPNVLVVNRALAPDAGRALTEELFTSLPSLVAAHKAALGIDLRSAIETAPLELHPGARAWYREQKTGLTADLGPKLW
jgi:TRAP transporter TAXI family solute receptor